MNIQDNPNYYFTEKPYKSKYICTGCRKSFKRKLLADIATENDVEEKEPKCPDCGKKTNWIGPKFRAPKSDNVKAWRSIEVLYDLGVLSFIGWASNEVEIPESSKGLKDLLIDMKDQYEERIRSFVRYDYKEENKLYINAYADMISRIDKYLNK